MKELTVKHMCVKNNVHMADKVNIGIYLVLVVSYFASLRGYHSVRAELQQLNGWQVLALLRPFILLISSFILLFSSYLLDLKYFFDY